MAKFTAKQKAILASYGIGYADITGETEDGKKTVNSYVVMPDGKLCGLPLKQGNTKTGKQVYTFSLLPTNNIFIIDGIGEIMGSCCETCKDEKGNITCYACKGNYNYSSTKKSLANNTILAYRYLNYLNNLLRANLDIIGESVDIRIHAAGDFFNKQYAEMWHEIARDYKNNRFWTYTKKQEFETMFDDLKNANIVKSKIDSFGYNYGHIDYILALYIYLVEIGEKPYICRCGIDKNQHCQGCNSCIDYKYVLFIEHSTDYKAEKDILFPFITEIVNAQTGENFQEIASRIYNYLNASEKAA